jgi:hypothetical protein
MNIAFKNKIALLASAIALLTAPALRAQTLAFDVNINTAALNAQDSANTPFYLDFQLNYGNSLGPANTVTLSNIQFTGGSALGTPTTDGTVSGSLDSGTVSLTASSSSQLNELYQSFSASTSDISFLATVSEAGSGTTPTEFTTALMDSSLGFPAQLYTTAPDTESMLVLNLSPTNTLANVGAYSSISSADGVTSITGVTATAVPEPSTTAAIVGCAAMMFTCCVRRFRKPQLAPQVA